jgi:hypothetical protein
MGKNGVPFLIELSITYLLLKKRNMWAYLADFYQCNAMIDELFINIESYQNFN